MSVLGDELKVDVGGGSEFKVGVDGSGGGTGTVGLVVAQESWLVTNKLIRWDNI